jgi:predicted RNA-binding Zn ribbon-like protein
MFLGGHRAIDFLNTAFAPDGQPVETVGGGREFLEWLVSAGLLEEAAARSLARRLGAKALDSAATEARKVREWARSWLRRWRAAPGADYADEISILNRLLARDACYREVIETKDGLRAVEREHIHDADGIIALIARTLAALITEEEASRVKQCAGSGCTLWFLDRTKGHRRLFCSAAACGNRAKVAAFRERQRQ